MTTIGSIGRGAALLGAGALAALGLAACGGHNDNTASGGSGGSAGTTSSTGTGQAASMATLPAASPSSHPATGGSGTAECKAANLSLSLGPGNGAAGHVYQALRFTNKGSTSCVIVGWPGVSYVTGDNGQQVGAPAARDGSIGPQVTLAPGQVASAIVTITDVSVFDPAQCKPTPTKGFRVYPPDETASVFVAQDGTGCAGNPTSPQLRVQTIKAGPGAP